MKVLLQLWRGEVPLPSAFWNWAVIGGLIVNIGTSILFLALMMNGLTLAAFIAGYGLSIPYNVLVTVGVWRSAARYDGERQYADLARIVTVVGMVILSVT